MSYRAGAFRDPSADPSNTIDRLCDLLKAEPGSNLRVHYRYRHLEVSRKRLAVFFVALLIAALVPGPGFLLGYWFIYRNSSWLLTVDVDPRAAGNLIRWSLRGPMGQGEMDARFGSVSPDDQLAIALGLLRSG